MLPQSLARSLLDDLDLIQSSMVTVLYPDPEDIAAVGGGLVGGDALAGGAEAVDDQEMADRDLDISASSSGPLRVRQDIFAVVPRSPPSFEELSRMIGEVSLRRKNPRSSSH